MKKACNVLAFVVLLTCIGCIQVFSAPAPPATIPVPEPPTYKAAPIEKLGGGKYRIGEILIDKSERSVSFPAQVNMDKGILEYLLVFRSGKTHESLLRTGITPYNLQVAFMLLGYEGTDKRLVGQGSPEIPKGEQLRITIHRSTETRIAAFPVERWLANRVEEAFKDVSLLRWVFTGSFVSERGAFMSQETGSIIAIWHDPIAMIDNASPGGENNRMWFAKEGTVPPVGTPVTVTIIPTK